MEDDIISRESLDRPLYRGLSNESDEELYFLWWCDELINAGILLGVRRAESIILAHEVNQSYTKITQLKTKVKEETKFNKILGSHIYTPDYIISWSNILIDSQFQCEIGSHYSNKIRYRLISRNINNFRRESIIEVKPEFDQNDRTRDFKVNQKWVWDKYKEYVNLILVPKILFENTFTPNRFLRTTEGNKPKRNIPFKVRTLEEFLKL